MYKIPDCNIMKYALNLPILNFVSHYLDVHPRNIDIQAIMQQIRQIMKKDKITDTII
jgi:hypothetical protein